MMFFDADGPDGHFPVSEIARMERGWVSRETGEEHPTIIHMKDGKAVHVMRETLDGIVRGTQQMIPAAPGHRLLTLSYDPASPDPGPWVEQESIFAWRAGPWEGLTPVLLGRDPGGLGDENAILEPDGRVQAMYYAYSSIAEWQAAIVAEIDEAYKAQLIKDAGGSVQ
jgi:hypothetical protein